MHSPREQTHLSIHSPIYAFMNAPTLQFFPSYTNQSTNQASHGFHEFIFPPICVLIHLTIRPHTYQQIHLPVPSSVHQSGMVDGSWNLKVDWQVDEFTFSGIHLPFPRSIHSWISGWMKELSKMNGWSERWIKS